MSKQSAMEFWKNVNTKTLAQITKAERPDDAQNIVCKAGYNVTIEELTMHSPKNGVKAESKKTIEAGALGGGALGGGALGGGALGGGALGGGALGGGVRGRCDRGVVFIRPVM